MLIIRRLSLLFFKSLAPHVFSTGGEILVRIRPAILILKAVSCFFVHVCAVRIGGELYWSS
jgi:hypothetical protein